jgi:hypothetical protein
MAMFRSVGSEGWRCSGPPGSARIKAIVDRQEDIEPLDSAIESNAPFFVPAQPISCTVRQS